MSAVALAGLVPRQHNQRRRPGVKGFAPGAAEAIRLVGARGRKRFERQASFAHPFEIAEKFDAAPRRARKIAARRRLNGVSEIDGGRQVRKILGTEAFILARKRRI